MLGGIQQLCVDMKRVWWGVKGVEKHIAPLYITLNRTALNLFFLLNMLKFTHVCIMLIKMRYMWTRVWGT